MKKILYTAIILVIGGWVYWNVMGMVWSASQTGASEKTIEVIQYEPEKVLLNFPEIEVFKGKILAQKDATRTVGGAWPPYTMDVSSQEFSALNRGEPFGVYTFNHSDTKPTVSITGYLFDSTVCYKTTMSKDFEIPAGKKVEGVYFEDGKFFVLQQFNLSPVSGWLVFERIITHVIWIGALVYLLISFRGKEKDYKDKISRLERRKETLREELAKAELKRIAAEAELAKVKRELDEKEREKPNGGGTGDGD
jgi:uncharacterized membrane protein